MTTILSSEITDEQLQEIMNVPIGVLAKHISEESLRNLLKAAIEKGISIGHRQAQENLNTALKLENLKYYKEEQI